MDQFAGAETTLEPLERLDADGVQAIHEASMYILEEVGIQVTNERARALVVDHGGSVDENDVVTIPRECIEAALERAPSSFTLHARNQENDVTVGEGGRPVRAPAYGPATVRTVADGRRPAAQSDYETFLRLIQTEPVITCTGYNVCEPTDLDGPHKHLKLLEQSFRLTDKPVMGSTYGRECARECLELAAIATDDPDLTRPVIVGLVNTVPPRSSDSELLEGLLTYAEYGQPVIVSSFTMAGASAPATLAGAMAQANAETLAGIALTQLVTPGTPVIYGVSSSNIDIRYGSLSIASPESALFISLTGQLARYYDLPARSGGALSDGKLVDYQSGFESMLTQAVTAFSGIDYVLHAAGILESYAAISPEKFVLDCEMVRYLDRFQQGLTVDRGQFAFDLIDDTPPAGHFLNREHTRSHATDDFYRAEVTDKRAYGDWADDGEKSALEFGRERVTQLLEAYEQPPMDDRIARRLTSYVEANT